MLAQRALPFLAVLDSLDLFVRVVRHSVRACVHAAVLEFFRRLRPRPWAPVCQWKVFYTKSLRFTIFCPVDFGSPNFVSPGAAPRVVSAMLLPDFLLLRTPKLSPQDSLFIPSFKESIRIKDQFHMGHPVQQISPQDLTFFQLGRTESEGKRRSSIGDGLDQKLYCLLAQAPPWPKTPLRRYMP